MNLGFLDLGFLPQSSQFKRLFAKLDIIAKEECGGKKEKDKEVKSNFEGLFMYPEVPSLGILLAKDKDIDIIFIQDRLPYFIPPRIVPAIRNPILIPNLGFTCQGFFWFFLGVSSSLKFFLF